jgi:hypothetical protein
MPIATNDPSHPGFMTIKRTMPPVIAIRIVIENVSARLGNARRTP